MTAFRSLKERARRRIHTGFGVAALYRATPESDWVPVSVRIHQKVSKFGDIPGLETAHFLDIAPRVMFLVEDLADGTPRRGAIVSVSDSEAWVVGEADPADGITVTASVAHVPPAQLGSFEVPE